MISPEKVTEFNNRLWSFYVEHQRKLPWRIPQNDGSFDPYTILVSEIMLQQTQVDRVAPYFERFICVYPDFKTLARAELEAVYRIWQGLGYNRRARFLRDAAQQIMNNFDGQLPNDHKALICLPGIGENTAGAIRAYAYNEPSIFIETNIRTVIIHSFFQDHTEKISDRQIAEILSATLDQKSPREYYWALMDYGTYLKKSGIRNNSMSKQYIKQASFTGSNRQLRGRIMARLLIYPASLKDLQQMFNDDRLANTLLIMEKEKLITQRKGRYFIAS